jgi:hypothetical protein
MKAHLEFDLPEEQHDLTLALNGSKMFATLWEIDQEMRTHLKHGGTRTADELAEWVRGEIQEIISLVE